MLYSLLLIICSLIIIAGLVGIIIPFLPGTLLVFLGVLIYSLFTKFATISPTVIIVLGFLTLISQIFDYLAQSIVAKKFGASKYGSYGGLIGLALGIIFSPVGLVSIIILPLFGTIIGELIAGKKILQSGKIGLGSLAGFFLALLFDILVSSIIIFYFLKAIL